MCTYPAKSLETFFNKKEARYIYVHKGIGFKKKFSIVQAINDMSGQCTQLGRVKTLINALGWFRVEFPMEVHCIDYSIAWI